MNYEVYVGTPHSSDAKAVSIPVKGRIRTGVIVKADGTEGGTGEPVYGVTGETVTKGPDGSLYQTVWVSGHIYSCSPIVDVPNISVVAKITNAFRIGLTGQKEEVQYASIIKL